MGILYSNLMSCEQLFCVICDRSAYSVIRRCVHRQTSNQFVVKIIDVAKYAANPKLSTEGELYTLFTNKWLNRLNVNLPIKHLHLILLPCVKGKGKGRALAIAPLSN